MKKKTFQRPKGWEKSIKSKFFDDSKTFDGDKYSDMKEKEKKKSSAGTKKSFFENLRSRFNKSS